MADLEIRNLHVRAGEKDILRGVDLAVGRGEIHALMGPNGSGKSTLANAVMGHPGMEVTEGFQAAFLGGAVIAALGFVLTLVLIRGSDSRAHMQLGKEAATEVA